MAMLPGAIASPHLSLSSLAQPPHGLFNESAGNSFVLHQEVLGGIDAGH
jgi:hypothetical protein